MTITVGPINNPNWPQAQMGRAAKLAAALRGEELERLKIGDYVKITEELDHHYDVIAEVHNVTWNQNPSLRDLHLVMYPFGGGVQLRRKVDPRGVRLLNEMEVLAEASK